VARAHSPGPAESADSYAGLLGLLGVGRDSHDLAEWQRQQKPCPGPRSPSLEVLTNQPLVNQYIGLPAAAAAPPGLDAGLPARLRAGGAAREASSDAAREALGLDSGDESKSIDSCSFTWTVCVQPWDKSQTLVRQGMLTFLRKTFAARPSPALPVWSKRTRYLL